MENLLSIRNLKIQIGDDVEPKELIKGLNLDIGRRKIVALVGGSGCGKTTVALSVLRLLSGNMNVTDGEILFEKENLLKLPISSMRWIRGKQISMIFQEPLSAFNPVFSVGYQVGEVLKTHTSLNALEIRQRIIELFQKVGLENPQRIVRSFPHQLSGGMRQRAMIAQAISVNPKLIIADEPTSNLDVTLQARIMDVFKKLKAELDVSILLITHDLGVVKELADEVGIMYNGRVVEYGKTQDVLHEPHHAYTSELTQVLRV